MARDTRSSVSMGSQLTKGAPSQQGWVQQVGLAGRDLECQLHTCKPHKRSETSRGPSPAASQHNPESPPLRILSLKHRHFRTLSDPVCLASTFPRRGLNSDIRGHKQALTLQQRPHSMAQVKAGVPTELFLPVALPKDLAVGAGLSHLGAQFCRRALWSLNAPPTHTHQEPWF